MKVRDYAKKAWGLIYNPRYSPLFNLGRGITYVGFGFLLYDELTHHNALLDALYHQLMDIPPHEREFASSHHHHVGEFLTLVGLGTVLMSGIVGLTKRVSSLEQKVASSQEKTTKE